MTLWTAARQAPLSMGFSRQEYWSELLFPPPGDLPEAGIEPVSPALAVRSLSAMPPGKHLQASSRPGAAQHHGARRPKFKARPCHSGAGASPVTRSAPPRPHPRWGVCPGPPSGSLRPTSWAETLGAHRSLESVYPHLNPWPCLWRPEAKARGWVGYTLGYTSVGNPVLWGWRQTWGPFRPRQDRGDSLTPALPVLSSATVPPRGGFMSGCCP